VVEAKLQRIFKELYYIGQVDMPSATFCGCVDVAAMMEGKPFHGYNERDLSVREARDLKQKILQKYEGVGQESIFLMLKQPINLLSGKMVPDFPPNSTPLWSVSEKRQLMAQFASLKFESYLAVEPVMIPCCGKKQFSSFLLHMCVQSKLSRRGTGQHRSYAFQELMAEDEDSFNRNVTASFSVGVFDCMPQQISNFMSKVSNVPRKVAVRFTPFFKSYITTPRSGINVMVSIEVICKLSLNFHRAAGYILNLF